MAASKKIKNVVVEPEVCGICADKYTSTIRRKITCKFCQAHTCSKCIENYLLTRHEDAHCLHCRVNYNDTTLLEICTKSYLQHTYFKHRQEVLINRERAHLPALQERALEELNRVRVEEQVNVLQKEVREIQGNAYKAREEYHDIYTRYYRSFPRQQDMFVEMSECWDTLEGLKEEIIHKKNLIYRLRAPLEHGAARAASEEAKAEETKKFIRRCTRDGCQGFLSTAWKCGICEWYSCAKCFAVKSQDREADHECRKEDLETAELIKKDCKPCPKCGEFIMKSSGCDQMFCISCQTPFSWNTGQIVTSGPIHNPHYYEWMKRTGGGAIPRNIGDVPCGGYPNGWQLVRFPSGVPPNLSDAFQYFHRFCMEMDDLANQQFRSHVDRRPNDDLHVQFLMNKMDEKKWGQQLAILEKKRKRDAEVQEVVGAFRMVAVELINRIQNYNEGNYTSIHQVPTPYVIEILEKWVIEVKALIEMINKAFENISRTYNYAVPYIKEILNGRTKRVIYIVEKTNLVLEKRKQTAALRAKEKEEEEEAAKAAPVDSDSSDASSVSDDSDDSDEELTEEQQLQVAIARSLQ